MTMPVVSDWADEYQLQLEAAFANASELVPEEPGNPGSPMRPKTADEMFQLSQEMWGKWVSKSVDGMSCIPPLTVPPPPISATVPDESAFAPNFKGKSSIPQIAAEICDQFESFAGNITWPMVLPAPPFTAIDSVKTFGTSITAAKAILLAGLIAELAVPTTVPSVKYTNLSTLLRTAFSSLTVEFSGYGVGSPPPDLIAFSPVS